MRKQLISFAILWILVLSACSSPAASPAGNPSSAQNQQGDALNPAFAALNRDKYTTYLSKFLVQFNGSSSWKYQLQTRKTPVMREYSLHIEGLDKSANPGDVRLVTNGTTSWMIGPGTDNECFQFPNNQGMDPTLIYPDSLVQAKTLAELLTLAGDERLSGIASMHYTGSAPVIGDWKDAQIDVWQDKASRGLLRFTMQASGEDPFFGKGAGQMTAQYEAAALDVEAITPVEGCEISAPLPESAKMLVRLPGLVSYVSAASLDEISKFYKAQLPKGNWTEKELQQQAEGVVVLSYQKDGESLEIQIETPASGGTKVKLMFLKD